MGKRIIVGKDNIVGPWVCSRIDGTWVPGRGSTIGLLHLEHGLIAGALYEDCNGANVLMHGAAVPGGAWLCREFLWFMFHYPFEQLAVRRITAVVPEGNAQARRFDEHLGFRLETRLKDAHPSGDLLIYEMRREDCRWLALKRQSSVQGVH
ncbi:MAG: hypothetical protein AzoDbin1_05110 [Azoarcus sp.]|nr:hypothetical protein [Azoarcus sp.]